MQFPSFLFLFFSLCYRISRTECREDEKAGAERCILVVGESVIRKRRQFVYIPVVSIVPIAEESV